MKTLPKKTTNYIQMWTNQVEFTGLRAEQSLCIFKYECVSVTVFTLEKKIYFLLLFPIVGISGL